MRAKLKLDQIAGVGLDDYQQRGATSQQRGASLSSGQDTESFCFLDELKRNAV